MIVVRYQQPVLNYIGRMVREREMALDFSQEIFLKVYASLRSYRSQFKFSTWLFKIASNYMIDHWRKRKVSTVSIDTQPEGEEDCPPIQLPDQNPSVVRQYELKELRTKIDAAIAKLPPHSGSCSFGGMSTGSATRRWPRSKTCLWERSRTAFSRPKS